jgi:hypothetical protein
MIVVQSLCVAYSLCPLFQHTATKVIRVSIDKVGLFLLEIRESFEVAHRGTGGMKVAIEGLEGHYLLQRGRGSGR